MTRRWSRPPEDLSDEPLLRACRLEEIDGVDRPVIGPAILLSKLGQGGMGVVYHGVHTRLGIEVAVKLLPLGQSSLAKRFRREAQIAARLRSDHLVQALDVDEDGPSRCHFIVMEYVHGPPADAWTRQLAPGHGVAETEALEVVIAATEGLQAAHQKGVVHRDIKPANILIPADAQGRPKLARAKLADLGLARGDSPERSLTGSAVAMGTPGYMSPEQARDAKRAKKPADVFSMGATLYALLAGRAPFAGSSATDALLRTAAGEYPPVSVVRPDIFEGTQVVIDRCLRPDPSERFPDATSLLLALRACRAGIGEVGGTMGRETTGVVLGFLDESEDGLPVLDTSDETFAEPNAQASPPRTSFPPTAVPLRGAPPPGVDANESGGDTDVLVGRALRAAGIDVGPPAEFPDARGRDESARTPTSPLGMVVRTAAPFLVCGALAVILITLGGGDAAGAASETGIRVRVQSLAERADDLGARAHAVTLRSTHPDTRWRLMRNDLDLSDAEVAAVSEVMTGDHAPDKRLAAARKTLGERRFERFVRAGYPLALVPPSEAGSRFLPSKALPRDDAR